MSPAAVAARPAPSATTARARAFVEAHRDEATQLGRRAGDLVQDPATLVATLREGLERLADPEYLAGQALVAPGIGPILGVRNPLLRAVGAGLRSATRRDRAATLLDVAGHLLRDPLLELHWLAFGILERTIADDPERTWQLVRAEAGTAADWITVDSLAHVAARGVLLEPYRWAELEQLVYSPSRWERRLAGSTVATMPHGSVSRASHDPATRQAIVRQGLPIVRDLIGDAEPDVQKALSWALRTLAQLDLATTAAFLREEARTARETADGHRAWVVRDATEKLPAPLAAELKDAVDGVRKRPGAPSTSRASATAAGFGALGLAVPPAERTVIDRTRPARQ